MILSRALAAAADRAPTKRAVALPDGSVSYAELAARVDQLARALIVAGVERGDRVCIWLPNSIEWVVTAFAIAKAGGIAVPINTRLMAGEVAYIVHECDPRVIVMAGMVGPKDQSAMLAEVMPELRAGGDAPVALAPSLRAVVSVESTDMVGIVGLDAFIARAEEVSAEALTDRESGTSPDDVVHIQYTSGTTAHPKGVMLTHRILLGNAAATGRAMRVTDADVVFTPAPLFHVGGFAGSLLVAIQAAATFVTMERFDAQTAMRLIERERCTMIRGTQTFFAAIIDDPTRRERDLSSLRGGVCGTSTYEARLAAARELGLRDLTTVYGLSETATAVTIAPLEEPLAERLSHQGLPIDGVEIRIADPTSSTEVPTNASGEILVRGWCVMKGYFGRPAETVDAIDADGWLHTGDLGRVDERGRLYFLGRLKDVIRVGGENVAAAEVESVLERDPRVQMAQVVAGPDDRLGEVCVAFVKLKPGSTPCAADELIDLCRRSIASFKVPRRLVFVEAFPLTPGGKPQKVILRERARQELARAG